MESVLERDLDPEEMEEEEDVFDSSSEGSSTQTSTLTWINWFTSLPGHDYFCDVHEDFIEDDFNLTGLQAMVPFWKEALEMVLDVEPEEDSNKIPDMSIVESSAELLYGLVHQRFILTKAGLTSMVEKYELGHFGSCPRVYCHWTHVLPVGRADMPGIDTVKLFCPNCGDIYSPPSSKYANVDGAFFGTTFGPLFFQTYPELLPAPFAPPANTSSRPQSSASSPEDQPPEGTLTNPNPHGGTKVPLVQIYQPRIYGFKVSERARSGPRMQWLRDRPSSASELDQVDNDGRWKSGSIPSSIREQQGDFMDQDRPSEKRTGVLFDDEDDEDDDEEEEEEEEEEGAGGKTQDRSHGLGLATGHSSSNQRVRDPIPNKNPPQR
ncbi:casein kinase II regulatory subunit-domain-containing protein [Kockovaella imperatae]|uniref:Casein kinase II subunit beta n=1 Tax=Kockovaella imperatae TaxID=4999 RepID=A0A1Y1UM25_9TREE|nr:casein kinase II regulatory subunit-domain-containing protein [Kockovaella imperatae]ORX38185.1 casein kinase II regulatory subunit-domain-containing protein [Kockovaella imperatae]